MLQIKLTPETAEVLSRQLREGSGTFMGQRRGAIALSLLAAGSMGVIALYQTGIIKHLPDPPLRVFDSDRIDGSAEAYSMLSTPDAVLGLGSYVATMALAAMGGEDRETTRPWIPLALAGKLAFDLAQAVRLSVQQWGQFRAFCAWCLLAAGATVATVPLVVPEALAALRHLRQQLT